MVAKQSDTKPLAGLKVLDFCWVVAGPMATKYLAEFGATVVRVESSKRPEVLRRAAPFKDGSRTSTNLKPPNYPVTQW